MAAINFINPLIEVNRSSKNAESCVLVIFGATGDLTARKLVPALYNLERDGLLPPHFACIGFARRPKDDAQFRKEMFDDVTKFSRTKPIDSTIWKSFEQKLFYLQSEFDQDDGYERLNQLMQRFDRESGTKGNRVFYLSTQPSFFEPIVEKLDQHQLIYPAKEPGEKWSRIIIEKPFGRSLSSAQELQKKLTTHLDESQIYRIDHYLGKETVQNLLAFRFANPIFEAVWNSNHIDNVQITVAEEIGIGTRGRFWEEAGMLRDIVQNHMMQLLSLVAMEPPANLQASSIRDEKVRVLQSITPFPQDRLDDYAIRGQYGPGLIYGEPVIGYRQEENVDPHSNVETFAALRVNIDNWRWAGVPFFLRAGKRLPKRATEIAIVFKKMPGRLLDEMNIPPEQNVLTIRIQPNEGVSLKMNCKVPSLNAVLQPVRMDFRYGSHFGSSPPDAYERLICDCMAGDNTLFARDDEVEASWNLLTPILERWENTTPRDFPNYEAGTWGPLAAENMLNNVNKVWRLI